MKKGEGETLDSKRKQAGMGEGCEKEKKNTRQIVENDLVTTNLNILIIIKIA